MATLDKGDRVWGAFPSSMDTGSYVSGDSFSENLNNSGVLPRAKNAASDYLASNETLFKRFDQWTSEPLSFLGSVSRNHSLSFFDNGPQDMQTRNITSRASFEEANAWPQRNNEKSSTFQNTRKRRQTCSNKLNSKRVKKTRAPKKDGTEFSVQDYLKCLNQNPNLEKQGKRSVRDFLASKLSLPRRRVEVAQYALEYQKRSPAQQQETLVGKYLTFMSRRKEGSSLSHEGVCMELGGISRTTLSTIKSVAHLLHDSADLAVELEAPRVQSVDLRESGARVGEAGVEEAKTNLLQRKDISTKQLALLTGADAKTAMLGTTVASIGVSPETYLQQLDTFINHNQRNFTFEESVELLGCTRKDISKVRSTIKKNPEKREALEALEKKGHESLFRAYQGVLNSFRERKKREPTLQDLKKALGCKEWQIKTLRIATNDKSLRRKGGLDLTHQEFVDFVNAFEEREGRRPSPQEVSEELPGSACTIKRYFASLAYQNVKGEEKADIAKKDDQKASLESAVRLGVDYCSYGAKESSKATSK